MPAPKVLLVSNTSWYLYNFRLPLIRDLRGRGFHVELVGPTMPTPPCWRRKDSQCILGW